MPYASAKQLDDALIPVVDIGPLRNGTDAGSVAAELHKANSEIGFIYVKNHGIAEVDLSAARDTALAFFRQEEPDKAAVSVSDKHRGWLASGGAKMGDDARADLKESFIWGLQDAEGRTPDDHSLRGANRWPEHGKAFETAAMAWFEAAHDVARDLMRAFAIGLGKDDDFFLHNADAPMSRASFVYYPPQPEELGDTQFGVGPHTDFGVLTVLAQDQVGGLQVQSASGDWIEAPPVPGTLVVNVGDLLARWTNDAYRSTPHRVVNSSGRERLSLVLAYDPGPDTMIDPRAVFGNDIETAYEPISCGDYLEWRFAKAFAYRK
ncbi:MAG: 2OG-Fe(II) oxygenase family protein [Pseudomonadota bacterium]